MNPAELLIYGSAPDLLETRRLVLKHAGFEVAVALSLERVKELLACRSFDLFILCHSLSACDCESALAEVHAVHPAMKNLILCKALSIRPRAEHDAYLTEFASPPTLIAVARELTTLGSRTQDAGTRESSYLLYFSPTAGSLP